MKILYIRFFLLNTNSVLISSSLVFRIESFYFQNETRLMNVDAHSYVCESE